MVLTRSERDALELLAKAGGGSTAPASMRGRCSAEELHRLVRGGLVKAERIQLQDKPPSPADFHLRISDTGRKALARQDERAGHGQISMKVMLVVLFVLALLAGMAVGAFVVPHEWVVEAVRPLGDRVW
jgi:hypothetical protein